jgi:hypothetical protein
MMGSFFKPERHGSCLGLVLQTVSAGRRTRFPPQQKAVALFFQSAATVE